MKTIVSYIKKLFPESEYIQLHAPFFSGKEKEYLNRCIDTNYVSSVGAYVNQFEQMITEYTGTKYAIATVNGTAALHTALTVTGVEPGDNVLTQAVSFIATANAICYCNATPVFIDSDLETLGMSVSALQHFLNKHTQKKSDGFTYNRATGKKISACVPMHVFGHPVQIDQIKEITSSYNITLIEDAAESIGSYRDGKHTGTFGTMGILSFNGNKVITTGGGGIILTNDEDLAVKARHLTTTAKISHPWEFRHDQIGYNYRMPNINAAIGCAQLEMLPEILEKKRQLTMHYKDFFQTIDVDFVVEPEGCQSNNWLNTIVFKTSSERDQFLNYSNNNGVMSRPIWTLLSKLPMYQSCITDQLTNALWIERHMVNIPSGCQHNITQTND